MTTAPALSPVAPTSTHSAPASRPVPDGLRAAWWPPVVAFLALACALSWWPWPLAGLSSRPDPAVLLPWGPSVAALVLTLRAGRADLRRLLRAMVRVRLGRLWWVLALPVAVASAALAVSVLRGAPAPSGSDLLSASVVAVATLPMTLVLAGPLGEELGWRGFLLPRLLQRFRPTAATLVLAGAWILFHLPLVVSRPQQYGPGWALTLVGVALVMTRLHLLSGGSLALAIAFHAVVNTATALAVRSLPEAHRPSAWLVVGGLWLTVGLAAGHARVPASRRRGLDSARTRVRIATAALAAVQFVLVLDSAIINVALATVARDLAVPTSDLTWVVNAYALTFGGLLLLGGRLADLVGRRRVFVLGTAVFGVASLSGAFAASPGWLITSRGLQGVGAALAAPAALALLVDLFPDSTTRAKALGLFGVVAGAGGSAGLLLGGILTESMGWRSVLWINVPLVLAVLGVSAVLPAAPRRGRRERLPLDGAGALTGTAGVGLLVYTVIEAPTRGWLSTGTVLLLLGAAAVLVVLSRIERTVADPLLPPTLVRTAGLAAALGAAGLMMAAMSPMWFLLTLHLQQDLGQGPVGAGLAVLPLSLTMMAANSAAPRAVRRLGARRVVAVGMTVAALGLAGLAAAVAAEGGRWALVVPSVVAGVGFGHAFVATIVAATSTAAVEQAGVASGLVTTSQQVGGALGLAAMLSLVVALGGAGGPGPTDFAAALLGAGLVAAGAAVAGTGMSRTDHRPPA